MTGEGEMESIKRSDPPASTVEMRKKKVGVKAHGVYDDDVAVPHFGIVSAGPGRLPVKKRSEVVVSESEWRSTFKGRKNDIGYFRVDGDSAFPVFTDGEDVPCVFLRGEDWKDDEVYIFRRNDHLYIKRLRHENGHVTAFSLNPDIAPHTFDPSTGDFEVIARVIVEASKSLMISLVTSRLRNA
ncbi:hypothetical protein [Salisaeta icosahedral phage 1]|uniref:hypothetical protein n=1 Tax=Salisaeta icosahedral phage 1 TaxID=1183239 RepID=UPI00025EA924|nr:hypothetical protein A322_gp23 [Salisaeta icosahedral phage 1]AFJ21478.1 hypothetical protein [Salisaeta icosahedral phage 1]